MTAPETRRPIADVAAHVIGLLLAVGLGLAVGRPEAWIAVVLPIGPLLAAAWGATAAGWREAEAFALVAAAVILTGWLVARSPALWAPLAILFPLGVLLVLLGTVNAVAVSISRAIRAWRNQPLDYPWIPDVLRPLLQPTEGE